MYFQRLENLKKEDEFKREQMIIDSLDEWLALVPKTYKDKLIPELFSVNQEVAIDISYRLFDKLVEENVLSKIYSIKCDCGQVLEFADTLEQAFDFIIEYNDDEIECSFCDEIIKINTDNVFVIYKLIQLPNMSVFSKKKNQLKSFYSSVRSEGTLSRMIENEPQKYIKLSSKEKLEQVISPKVREKIDFLLE